MQAPVYSDGDTALMQHWRDGVTPADQLPPSLVHAMQFVWNHAGLLLLISLAAFLFVWLRSYSEMDVTVPSPEPMRYEDAEEESDSDDDFVVRTLQTTMMSMNR